MLTFIVIMIVIGLIAGLLARLLVPGRDPMGIGGTILLGIAGSFVGGFLEQLIVNHRIEDHLATSGIVGSILGAVVLLLLLRVTRVERRRRRRHRFRWI
jgi:uncharacterized membrane protein YeaQ/YmgE (transglycosylase-associated protein family)